MCSGRPVPDPSVSGSEVSEPPVRQGPARLLSSPGSRPDAAVSGLRPLPACAPGLGSEWPALAGMWGGKCPGLSGQGS